MLLNMKDFGNVWILKEIKKFQREKLEIKSILKKNKILITGGTGFIGYHLAKKCLDLNWSVDSISTKSPPLKRKLKNVVKPFHPNT